MHAHLNLLGWASLALMGLTYRAWPELAARRGPALRAIRLSAAAAAWIFPFGIWLAIEHQQAGLAIGAALVWMAGALLFLTAAGAAAGEGRAGAARGPDGDVRGGVARIVPAHHLPIPQGHHPVHPRGEVRVMGGDQRGQALAAHRRQQFLEDQAGGADIEVAGRLVGQQDARRIGQGAGDRHALLLAAGEAAGPVVLAAPAGRSWPAAPVPRSRAAARGVPAASCGSTTFSSAVNSGSRWWNW